MWIDAEGVCHTVALPDPTALMSSIFRGSLDRLLSTSARDVAEVVESEEARFYRNRSSINGGAATDVQFEGIPSPVVLHEPVGSLDDLRALIRGVDYRWRLDALAALDDYTS